MDRNEEDRGKVVAVPPAGIRTMMSGTVQTTGGDFSNSLSDLRPAVVNKLEQRRMMSDALPGLCGSLL